MACSWCRIDRLPENKRQSAPHTIRCLRLDDGTHTKGVAVRDADGIVKDSHLIPLLTNALRKIGIGIVIPFNHSSKNLRLCRSSLLNDREMFMSFHRQEVLQTACLMTSHSLSFHLRTIAMQQSNAFFKSLRACLLQFKTTCANDSLSNDFQIGKPNYRFEKPY